MEDGCLVRYYSAGLFHTFGHVIVTPAFEQFQPLKPHIRNLLSVDGYPPAQYLPILLFRSVCIAGTSTLTRRFRKSM